MTSESDLEYRFRSAFNIIQLIRTASALLPPNKWSDSKPRQFWPVPTSGKNNTNL
ncbi:hypothetical protein [Escherichia phage UPEC06]|nr:hypothetical protein [Escherichia phage UPEC06]QUL77443.1 hypothetical protein [Escherichia phage UPEC06]